jgi:hypothetical protein
MAVRASHDKNSPSPATRSSRVIPDLFLYFSWLAIFEFVQMKRKQFYMAIEIRNFLIIFKIVYYIIER